MFKNKKNVAIISAIVILALAVAVIVSVSAKGKNAKAETPFVETIAENVDKQTSDNTSTVPVVTEEVSESAATDVKTTAVLETTTKRSVGSTKKPVETTRKVVSTTKVVPTTQDTSRSLLEATDIPGKYPATAFEKAFFNAINNERTKRGIPALIWNDNLHALSGVRSREIVSKWGHERPNGKMPISLLDEYNISRTTFGENLAGGTPMEEKYIDTLVKALLDSPGHKENLLATKYKYTAVSASVNSDGVVYVAQLFYTP